MEGAILIIKRIDSSKTSFTTFLIQCFSYITQLQVTKVKPQHMLQTDTIIHHLVC